MVSVVVIYKRNPLISVTRPVSIRYGTIAPLLTCRIPGPWFAATALICLATGCVKRDNPFDPLNYRTVAHNGGIDCLDSACAAGVLDSINPLLAAEMAGAMALSAELATVRARLENDSAANAATIQANAIARAQNEQFRSDNDAVAAYNDTVSTPDSLKTRKLLGTLSSLAAQDTLAVSDARIRLTIARLSIQKQIAAANDLCAIGTLYPALYRDSVVAPIDSLLVLCHELSNTNQYAADTNALVIEPFNETVRLYNLAVTTYNDSISFHRLTHSYTKISEIESLTVLLRDARPGRRFAVDPGNYEAPYLRFDSSGTVDAPIIVQGHPDMTTIFNSADLELSGREFLTFRHILFDNNGHVKLVEQCRGIVFDHCYFENAGDHSIEIIDSDARLVDCRVTKSGGHGIVVSSSLAAGNTVHINNTLIAHNTLHGISIAAANVFLQNVTISDQSGDGIHLTAPELDLSVTNSIISYLGGYPIFAESGFAQSNVFTLDNTILHGNAHNTVPGTFEEPLEFPQYEPGFVSHNGEPYDYAVTKESRLHELEQESGIVIGYRPD